jgi:hypothetical protein
VNINFQTILEELLKDVLEIKQINKELIDKQENLKQGLEKLYNSKEWVTVKKIIEEIKINEKIYK